MSEPKPIRYLVIPVALLALLLVGMTLGSVWHHHNGSSESTCPICHLNHQPIDRPVAADQAPTLALVAPTPEPQDTGLAPAPVFRPLPARAPPIA
ncbi:MAG TPA: hypothetical protein VN822_03665 [Candidatus Acidoferrales bacterium]|nr:hypothetical protein [Candidatus Acidoferrales bacterium]